MSKVIEDIITKTKAMGNTMAGSKLQSLQLAEALNGYSIGAIKASISESTLNEMQIRTILSQKGLTGNILETTTAELAAITTTNSMTVSEGAATTATVGLGTAIKGLGVTLKTFVASHPYLVAIAAAIGAIYAAVKIVDACTTTFDELKDKISNLKQEVSDSESTLKDYKTQLDGINQKITEINNQDSLSITDEQELKNLKDQKTELENMYNIEKARHDLKQQELENSANEYFNKKFNSDYATESYSQKQMKNGQFVDVLYTGAKKVTKLEEMEAAYNTMVAKQKELNQLEEKYNQSSNHTNKDTKEYEKKKSELKKDRDNAKTTALDIQEEAKQQVQGLDSTSESYQKVMKASQGLSDALARLNNDWNSLSEDSKRKDLFSTISKDVDNSITDGLREEYQKISDWGLDDYADQIKNGTLPSQFGNIDMDNRQIIDWNIDNIEKWKDALSDIKYYDEDGNFIESYYDQLKESAKNGESCIDTVFGDLMDKIEGYGDITALSFSHVVNNDDGTFEFLGQKTAEEYLYGILDVAKNDGDMSIDHILELDKKGFEDAEVYDSQGKVIGKTYIHGIISGFNDNANDISKLTHFAGNFGAVQILKNNKKSLLDNMNEIKDYLLTLSDDDLNILKDVKFDENTTVKSLKEVIKKAREEADKNPVEQKVTYAADFKTLNDSLSSLTEHAELLSKVNKEISESGRISAENLKKINEAFPEDKYPEMTKALYQYENGLINSTQLFEKLEEAYNTDSENYAENVKSKAETDNNYYSILKELYPSLFENLQSLYQGDFNNWKNLAEAKKGVELKLISEIGSAWKAYYNVFQTEDGSYDYASTGVTVDRGADTGDEDEARELENAAMDKYKADAKKFVDGMNEALAEINKLYPDITAPSWQELSPDTSKSSSKDSTDAWKEEAEKQIKLLDHYHNMGYLSDEQYYKALNELNEKYYAGQEKYLDDYRSYAEKIYSGLKQAYSDMLNKQKDYMGQAINAVTGYLDDQIDALNDQKDAVEDEYNARIEALESEQNLLDEQKDAIEEQKNAIQEQIDAIDKANEARQKAIDLQKKQYELNRAMNQNTNKVYVNGQMVWQTDDSAITDARNDLEDAKAQDATDKLQDQIDELDKASDALDKQKDALQDQIDSLNDELDKITEGIEKQIDELQKYKDRWAEIPDQFTYVQNQMIASMMLGQDWQQKALSMNEDMLYTFGTSYNNIQGQLQLVTDASAQDIVNMAQLSGEQLGILAAQADESLTEMGGSIQGQSEISEEALNQLMLAGTDSLSTLASKVGESSQSVCTSIGDIISKASDAITTLNQLSELQDKMDFAPIYSGVTVTAMRNGGVVEVETARKGTVTGSHRSKIAKSLGEDHLVVAREGEGFVPPEQVKDVQDSVRAVNKFADLLIPAEPKFKFDNFDVGQTVMSSNLIKQPGLDFNGVSNTTSQNNTIKIESGAIVLNEVTKPDVVGEAIIKELPNYVTRKLNQR